MLSILLDNDFGQVTPIVLPDKKHQKTTSGHVDGLNISTPYCTAQVSLYGGQVLSYKPVEHRDILWVSNEALYQKGKAIRGGIPLCWPWFGANDKQNTIQESVGNHGFARQLPWTLDSVSADKDGVTVVLGLKGEGQHPIWPNAYELKQTLFFGNSLKQSLSMTNLSSKDAQYSSAFHSYFTVSDPKNVKVDTLTGITYHDKLTDDTCLQKDSVSCIGEIDREYHTGNNMTIIDGLWQRKIDISSNNCQQWVLWNPGKALANTMVDIHAGGEQEYVCLEAANTNWQALPSGATVIISQEIKVTYL
jgi:glucose-6-phosphate 1-epimerase